MEKSLSVRVGGSVTNPRITITVDLETARGLERRIHPSAHVVPTIKQQESLELLHAELVNNLPCAICNRAHPKSPKCDVRDVKMVMGEKF